MYCLVHPLYLYSSMRLVSDTGIETTSPVYMRVTESNGAMS
jgi:hypothetical protein